MHPAATLMTYVLLDDNEESDIVMEYSKLPQKAGIHNPFIQTKKDNILHYIFEKYPGRLYIFSLLTQNFGYSHPLLAHFSKVGHNWFLVIVVRQLQHDKAIEGSKIL